MDVGGVALEQSGEISRTTPVSYTHKINFRIKKKKPQTRNMHNGKSEEFEKIRKEIEIKCDIDYNILEEKFKKFKKAVAELSLATQREVLDLRNEPITENLSKSIRISGNENIAIVGTDLFYARYVNDGRGIVEPVNKPYLRFYYHKAHRWITSYHIEPSVPSFYLEDSARSLENNISELAGLYLDQRINLW